MTASILGFAGLEVDKLFATQSDKFMKISGKIEKVQVSTFRTVEQHSLLALTKSFKSFINELEDFLLLF